MTTDNKPTITTPSERLIRLKVRPAKQQYRVVAQTTPTIHKQTQEGGFEPLNRAELEIFNGLIEALRAANVLGETTRLSDLQAVRIIEAFAAICPQILQQEVNENE